MSSYIKESSVAQQMFSFAHLVGQCMPEDEIEHFIRNTIGWAKEFNARFGSVSALLAEDGLNEPFCPTLTEAQIADKEFVKEYVAVIYELVSQGNHADYFHELLADCDLFAELKAPTDLTCEVVQALYASVYGVHDMEEVRCMFNAIVLLAPAYGNRNAERYFLWQEVTGWWGQFSKIAHSFEKMHGGNLEGALDAFLRVYEQHLEICHPWPLGDQFSEPSFNRLTEYTEMVKQLTQSELCITPESVLWWLGCATIDATGFASVVDEVIEAANDEIGHQAVIKKECALDDQDDEYEEWVFPDMPVASDVQHSSAEQYTDRETSLAQYSEE